MAAQITDKRQSKLLLWARSNWFLVLFLAVIIGAFVFLRSKPSNVQNANELSALLTDGKPTVLEFYSNF